MKHQTEGLCPFCGGTGLLVFNYNKRANGHGSLYQSANNGRWYAQVMRHGVRRTRSSKDRDEAERMLRELLSEDW